MIIKDIKSINYNKTSNLLIRKGIESWCPLNKIEKQWTDRKKIIEEPLFKSYVFVFTTEQQAALLMHTDGVINLLHWLGKHLISFSHLKLGTLV